MQNETTITFTRIDNDTNGNPRYVCHSMNLLCAYDRATLPIDQQYEKALKNSRGRLIDIIT